LSSSRAATAKLRSLTLTPLERATPVNDGIAGKPAAAYHRRASRIRAWTDAANHAATAIVSARVLVRV
jgi:hypothetical protein